MRTVTGLVLAAGSSRRLGRPKQVLPLAGGTLLGTTLDRVRRCGFDQVLVTLGGARELVEQQVDLFDVEVVPNPEHSSGCSSSIAAALPRVRADAAGVVLLLGDQPMVDPDVVGRLVEAVGEAPIGAVRYRDGLGHPFWLGRRLFDRLGQLHGDKGVWKLIDEAGPDLVTVEAKTQVPLDVDTEHDYERLLAQVGAGAGGLS